MIEDPSKLRIRGLKNGKVQQDCGTEYVQPRTFLILIPVLISTQ